MSEIVSTKLNERVAQLRVNLNSLSEGQKLLQKLIPTNRLQTDNHNVVDFCDWQQFSQWPQSGIGL